MVCQLDPGLTFGQCQELTSQAVVAVVVFVLVLVVTYVAILPLFKLLPASKPGRVGKFLFRYLHGRCRGYALFSAGLGLLIAIVPLAVQGLTGAPYDEPALPAAVLFVALAQLLQALGDNLDHSVESVDAALAGKNEDTENAD
jgi:hypothetical protein